MASQNIYCGNNRLHSSLQNGTLSIGTRYRCLRKGIGRGMNMPLDPDYQGDYEPLFQDNFYCGDEKKLPAGYDRFGTLSDCLTKGIGVGKRIIATQNQQGQMAFGNKKPFVINYNLLFLIILVIILIIALYKIKNRKIKIILSIIILIALLVNLVVLYYSS